MAKHKPIIGKSVLESLTLGMYDDSRFIYREYVQNAADQIDLAIREGILKEGQGEIFITIDPDKRIISIEDNATGIAEEQVLPLLQNIAQGNKRRGVDKGFRGIGRLGGLGYCDKLMFETSFKGEPVKSTLIWDATLLKDILNNSGKKEEASDVLETVTNHWTSKETKDAHYFKLTLSGVTNSDLLDVKEVRHYLSMVAPVPFSNKFHFKSKIYKELQKEKLSIDEYKIYINTEVLEKGYKTYIYKGDENKPEKVGEVMDVQFFKDYDKQGNLLFWGWYSLTTNLNEQMRSINRARGFRLRKFNIQIGNESTLEKLHRESRGNFYYFGEVYAFHPDLVPNSRRDYFVENNIYFDFEKKLRSHFYKLKDVYYAASDASSAVNKIEKYQEAQKEFAQKLKTGFVDKEHHKDELEKLEKMKSHAEYAKIRLEKLSAKHSANEVIQKVITKVTENKPQDVDTIDLPVNKNGLKLRTDNLKKLKKDHRKFLSKIFSIIRNVLQHDTAEELITKIEEELK